MKYDGSTNISYINMLEIIKGGVIGKVKSGRGKHKFAHCGGNYIGAPGKELYFSLLNITSVEAEDISSKLALKFPATPPGNHVKWAACIRYIQGCFEKQGCLRSKEDRKRMINEKNDWDLSFKFMDLLKNRFEENNILYGLVIWHEMTAHRYGDLSIVYPEKMADYLEKMECNYIESQKNGIKIKSWKHSFTPFYWAGHYFYEVGYKEKSEMYHKKNLEMMNKYCPDARPGYREKSRQSVEQLRSIMGSGFDTWFRSFRKKIVNKCLKKSLL